MAAAATVKTPVSSNYSFEAIALLSARWWTFPQVASGSTKAIYLVTYTT